MPEHAPMPTIPERIAARRLRDRLRHARALGAAGGTVLAALAVGAFAVAEDSSPPDGTQVATSVGASGPTGPANIPAPADTGATGPAPAAPADPPAETTEVPAATPVPEPDADAASPAQDRGSAAPPAGEQPTAAATEPAATPAPSQPQPVATPTAPMTSTSPTPARTGSRRPAPTKPAVERPRRPATFDVDPVYAAAPITVKGARPSRAAARPETGADPTEEPAAPTDADADPAAPAPATAADDGVVPPPSAAAVAWSGLTGFSPPLLSSGEAASFPGPRALLPIYLAASLEHDVPWELLAAINSVETDFGRNVAVSSAGAVGWMQFMPSTWARYGEDGDGDGVRDPDDPVDAIFAAAAYLHASGAPKDLQKAVFAYNHSQAYVSNVLGKASGFASIDPTVLASLTEAGLRDTRVAPQLRGHRGLLAADASTTSIGRLALLDDKALGREVLRRADIYPCGAQDIEQGVVDRRVLLTLAVLTTDKLRPTVSSLRCGHGVNTSSGNLSEHTTGTAVDVSAINGVAVIGHQGPGTDAERVMRRAAGLRGALEAHQVISLMTLAGAANTMSMADHADHVHIGFRPAPRTGDDSEHPQEDPGKK